LINPKELIEFAVKVKSKALSLSEVPAASIGFGPLPASDSSSRGEENQGAESSTTL
jgi:hypothetical protein